MKTSLVRSCLVVAALGLGAGSVIPVAAAESAPSKPVKVVAAKGEGAKSIKAAPAKDESEKKQPEASSESKPKAKPEAEATAAPDPQPARPAEEMERKISPYGAEAPPQAPLSAEDDQPPSGNPPPMFDYPPPGYGPGYPPPGYPPPGYGQGCPSRSCPPPGFISPHCRFCPSREFESGPHFPVDLEPGRHTHDGFFLRFGLGGGVARTSIPLDDDKLVYSGTSIPVNLAIGAAIRPNLILFGEAIVHEMSSPERKFANETQTASSTNLSIQGVGPGLAYYFMPVNIYVSGSLLIHKVTFNHDGHDKSGDMTTVGFAGNLMVGKEWWVSHDWGVGLALQAMLGGARNRAHNDASGSLIEDRWTSMAMGLLMSATYN